MKGQWWAKITFFKNGNRFQCVRRPSGTTQETSKGNSTSASFLTPFQTDLLGTIERLLSLEKTSRVEEDVVNTRLCCLAILDICFQSRKWTLLNEQIQLLAKRRGQMKQAIQAFVRQAMEYIDQTPDQDTKVELIKTLQSVTEGKVSPLLVARHSGTDPMV